MKIGLLPLYIKLYDDFTPSYRTQIDAFYKLISNEFVNRGVDVINVEVCRVKSEFENAVRIFENKNVNAIVTLHLAYSPSLESSDALKNTKLPILVLDTTPDYTYDGETDPSALSYNHGIHGVQDMCNLLRRNKKDFSIFAGHWQNSDVINRVVNAVKGIKIADIFKNSRAGIVGEPFDGMGDFSVNYDLLGINVVKYQDNDEYNVTADEIESEYQKDSAMYDLSGVSKEVYKKATPVELKLRKWIETERLNSFTINFLATSKNGELPYMPFSLASKAMRDGIGYAGEGDIMTSVLVGAFLSEYEFTSFTEMFCPDWNNNTVFLSHMGEQNLKCVDGKAIMFVNDFPYTDAGNPTAIYGTFKTGNVLFMCIAPQADDKFMLVVSDGEMIQPPDINKHTGSVNGWFKPKLTLPEFLEEYSKVGGIHHAALVYDGDIDVVKQFAKNMGFDIKII